MFDKEHCVVRVGRSYWLHHSNGTRFNIGSQTDTTARAWAKSRGIPFMVVTADTQEGFAHDVAIERFALNQGEEGLWMRASTSTPIWARF